MSEVQLSEISLKFHRDTVLDGINLSIGIGEYVVVLGASGCGKTSLLRMIAGLIPPTAGRILLSGKDVRRIAPRNRNVTLVPQHAGLYPHLSIADSIALGIRDRMSRIERERRVHEAASIVEMDPWLDRRPEQLSGGQVRRAAVAKAIASRASVRLLDEPLSAIDASLRFQIEKDLIRMHRQAPGVTVHVTHDGAEAMRLADRVAVIENGRIAQLDTPETLRSQPATPGVAAALGQSPLATVSLCRAEGVWVSATGQEVDGPDARTGATGTLAYYEENAFTPGETGGAASGDWIDAERNIFVRQEKLFWFVE